MPSSHLILCRPLLLLPPIPPSIRVFSSESNLCTRWPKYWSFSFSIIPSKEIPVLISFRMDWLDLLAVQGTLKSLLELTPIDRSTKQKINKETQTLNDTIDQLDLIDIHRTFYPKTMNFTFFPSAHGTFSRIDHILGHKSSLGKFKKIEIIPRIFSDHNAVRLDLNYRRKTVKNSNIWKLNNMLLNNQQITEEILKRNQNMHRNE